MYEQQEKHTHASRLKPRDRAAQSMKARGKGKRKFASNLDLASANAVMVPTPNARLPRRVEPRSSTETTTMATPNASQASASTPTASSSYPAYPIAAAGQGPQAGSSQAGPSAQERATREAARKDKSLAEFMLMLDDYEPLVSHYLPGWIINECSKCIQIPDEVTDYYLQRVGFDCQDPRLYVRFGCVAKPY